MPSQFPFFLSAIAEEAQNLRRKWGWFVGIGAAMCILGLLAIGFPHIATLTTIEVFGYFLLIGGAIEIASSIWTRGWGGFFLHLICGLLSLFVGVVLIDRPLIGAAVYTVLMAMYFVATGVIRAIVSVSQRYSGWGWGMLSGGITFLLGLMIWRQLPDSAIWVLGLFVGVDLVFNGWSWVMLGLAVRSIPPSDAARTGQHTGA